MKPIYSYIMNPTRQPEVLIASRPDMMTGLQNDILVALIDTARLQNTCKFHIVPTRPEVTKA
jgi:hypothetical protein